MVVFSHLGVCSLEKYATGNGYALVLDVSNRQTPVLWASQTIDITGDIVKLYDQANPGTGAPATAKAPAGGTASALAPAPAAKKESPAGTDKTDVDFRRSLPEIRCQPCLSPGSAVQFPQGGLP